MLTPDLLDAVKGYTKNLKKDITFALESAPDKTTHPKREELVKFLTDLSRVSDKLSISEVQGELFSTLSFKLLADGKDTGIVFSGIPGGHEFSSLVLAILQAGEGSDIKLDSALQDIIRRINTPLKFVTYVSLSCHNCPDVVQALNQFALLNSNIRHEMIDGGEFQQVVDQKGIQGVPCVYLNDAVFANGKIDTAKLVDKLLQAHPELAVASSELPVQDVLVVGGGPAGVAAAIYAARKGVAVTVVADRIGGQVKDTMGIENFISVPQTTGSELSSALAEHLKQHNITLKEGFRVNTLQKADAAHKAILNTGEVIESRTVIVASGAKWRELGVSGEKENIGNGVAYCPHCDGPFFKGKNVAVIGGGNSGVEAALDLAHIVNHVTVFEFMPSLKADKILVDKMTQRSNIDVITHAATQSINAADGKVASLTYTNRNDDTEHTLDLSAVFVQIGLVPNSQLAQKVVSCSQYGEIIINDRCETSTPGIFACGDVTTTPYKQIVIAMGEGAKAALAAFDYLLKS